MGPTQTYLVGPPDFYHTEYTNTNLFDGEQMSRGRSLENERQKDWRIFEPGCTSFLFILTTRTPFLRYPNLHYLQWKPK